MASNTHDSWTATRQDAGLAGVISPGWYPDPTRTCQRYWDGARWTDQVAPLPQRESGGPKATTGDWIGGVLLSVLFPLLGLVVGIVYFLKGGEKRSVGSMCLLLSVAGLVVTWMLVTGARSGY